MSTPLHPLPDLGPLKAREVAAAYGISVRGLLVHLARGRFPGAFRTPGNAWRIPHAAALAVGRELEVLE
jgi:hypothetical protein